MALKSNRVKWPVSGSNLQMMRHFLSALLWQGIERLLVVFIPFLIGWLSLGRVFEHLFCPLFMEEVAVRLLFFKYL
jgi:hypothetical protein